MKYLDIVSKNDKIIGEKTAKECHSNNKLIHRVVNFTFVDTKNKKVLITKKFDSKLWSFVSEHVLSGENYPYVVSKSAKSKLGVVDISFGEHAHHIFNYDRQTEFARFFLMYWKGQKLKLNKLKIINYEWITIKKLIKNINNYPEMTKYWVKAIDWKKILDQYTDIC